MTADLFPLRLLFVTLAGWVNRHQQQVIEYLMEENRVLREQLNQAANNDVICGATDRPLRPSPAAAGHWSITICPIDDVGQGPPVQIGAQIVAEEVDPPMLTHVTAARDMRGDEDALIVPEAAIGFVLKLTLIDVEGHPTQRARRKGGDQRLFVDDFAPRDVHEDRAWLHGGKSRRTDQPGRLRCPLTADHHAIALREERMQTLGTFQAAE